ncbi:enoyl-CoA hydratase/isomerase family protein [Methylobacterium sp. Leaf85]|uniref:enoyl-CoA hydratase/isomerase family protein n=1 Tax=Methylobacterium sp. Leaf85 TaxID=1736241 RepID=UPI0006F80787|nr:enoyl-CoA hydratase/isomerase family protein [Methylobacterium sp. Leaf85]KQO41159.1 3-hydroxyisobutyryl-CoA hydrolase [Methylobacterium sp. Leaf85]
MTGADEPEILFERRGHAGLITLNRPKALNALTVSMTTAMYRALWEWERDDTITRVVVRGRGGRAFCAGGDIRQIHDLARRGLDDEVRRFWLAEYHLNAYVQRYTKPYIALIEGIVMGGGVGLSLHGSHRVSSERYTLAMPEVGIGFFPDVGMTHSLPRLAGRAGVYLALTGARIGAGDARALGLATHHAAAENFDAITDELAGGGAIERAFDRHATAFPEVGPITAHGATIEACFSADSVAGILARLDADGSPFATETAALMRTRSPHSLCIAHEQMRRGIGMDFAEAMQEEYRLAMRAMHWHDFHEGVRAVLVDKDNRPDWRPAALADVDPAGIAEAFTDLPDGDAPRFDGSATFDGSERMPS